MTPRHLIAANYQNTAPDGQLLTPEEEGKLFGILDERYRSWTGKGLTDRAMESAPPAPGIEVLASALQKFAPDLMEQLAERHADATGALEKFLVFLKADADRAPAQPSI